MTELSVLFPGFGQATIAACDGTNLTLCADFPAAPGRPLSGVLETVGKPVSLKVRGSRHLADGRYEIDGRFVSLPRELRELLLASLAEPGSSPAEAPKKTSAPPNSPGSSPTEP